jgi:hypothetical protein
MAFAAAQGSTCTCHVPMPGSKWQPKEDEKLIELLTNGLRWGEIS